MSDEQDFNEIWSELEKDAREKFETVLNETKRAWLKKNQPTIKGKKLPIFPVKILFIDADYNLPLHEVTFNVFGNREEIAKLLENHTNAYLKTFQKALDYKRQQSRLFVDLVDNYKMEPTDVYPLLHNDYESLSAEEKRRFQNRLRTHYARVTKNKKPKI
jgi:hypothetical protein